MTAIVFPPTPLFGDVYPAGSGTPGISQWVYDGLKWNVVPVFVRTNNQLAYNAYEWPNTLSTGPGRQLTDVLADGNLSWATPSGPFFYLDDISSQFDGVTSLFELNIGGVPYSPTPPDNLIVVLGGIPQTPSDAWSVTLGNFIQFSAPPLAGTSCYMVTVNPS